MDRVFIENLTVETVIGIFDWEREIKQAVSLDLEMDFDIRAAAASDSIADALDYKAVSKRLIGFIERSQFQLVEALAERCAAIVLEEFPVARLRLKLSKPGAVRGSSAVGVTIERQRPGTSNPGTSNPGTSNPGTSNPGTSDPASADSDGD